MPLSRPRCLSPSKLPAVYYKPALRRSIAENYRPFGNEPERDRKTLFNIVFEDSLGEHDYSDSDIVTSTVLLFMMICAGHRV